MYIILNIEYNIDCMLYVCYCLCNENVITILIHTCSGIIDSTIVTSVTIMYNARN